MAENLNVVSGRQRGPHGDADWNQASMTTGATLAFIGTRLWGTWRACQPREECTRHWSDLAGQTPGDRLSKQGLGEGLHRLYLVGGVRSWEGQAASPSRE